MTIITILINYLFPTSVEEVEEDQEHLVDPAHEMRAFVVELDVDLLLLLLDRLITLQTTMEHSTKNLPLVLLLQSQPAMVLSLDHRG